MIHCCSSIRGCLGSYDHIQCAAALLLYLQVICSIVGSLGSVYAGICVANLAVALFALVAIESGNQTLARSYAALLLCMLLLDISWFILFSQEIWHVMKDQEVEILYKISVKIVFSSQVIGFLLRLFSAFLWLQMYRLGSSREMRGSYEQTDFGGMGTVGFITPLASPAPSRQVSIKEEESVGGSIYNPAYYSSLFQAVEVEDEGDGYVKLPHTSYAV